MTNIYISPEKKSLRDRLFEIAEEALRGQGWNVERIPRSGKASLRRLTKGNIQKTATIRTSQDTWIAFPRTPNDDAWSTLAEADYVVASSIDDPKNPRYAQVHLFEGDEIRARFDRAYAARKKAGRVLPIGRGVWLSLYEREAATSASLVGAGVGLDHPPIARVSLTTQEASKAVQERNQAVEIEEAPLTIAEAKRRLAFTFGVTEADVKIVING